MYYVTMRRVRITSVAVENQHVLHILSVCVCVCSLRYPARKTHAQHYIVVCGLCGSTSLSTLSHKRHDFGARKLLNMKRVLIFSRSFD